ncbi:MAG: hypothetical protein HKO57_03465 [Akkermansiaceae bacterium]|nr:hypothetical protein [Akkermansiaceae bacterium]
MTFLQPLLLYGLLGAAIPVIIHLLNRRRFRTVKWAAMQFLLKATRESRGKKRLKHILILTCRALAIAALAFAVARPLVGGLLGWGGGTVDTVILILDRSASMERSEGSGQPGKRASVLQRVAEAMKELGGARLVLIDSATGKAQEVPSPEVLPELSTTAPTDTTADMPALASAAVDYIQDAQPGRAEIWIASDLQSPDWQPEDARWSAFRATLAELDQNVELRILALKSRERNDYAIRVLGSRREGNELVLDLMISREEDAGPVSLPVTFNLGGARSAKAISLDGQSLRFQKRLPLAGTDAGGHGWVSIPSDANPRNNVSYYAFGAEAPENSFLVTDPDTSQESLDALVRAAAPGFTDQNVRTLASTEAHLIDWNIASLVIWNAALPTGPVGAQLLEFIRSGGVALFLPPAGPLDEAGQARSIGGIAWGPLEESPQGRYFIVKDWDHADGPLRDGADGTALPLQRLRAIKRQAIVGDATVLARWDDDAPLLVRRVIDDGVALFLSTLPDYTWSNLEQTAVHLVLIQRALDQGSRRLGAGYFGTAGESSARPVEGEIASRLDTYSEYDPANAPFTAGVYRFGERTVAVNRPPGEDTLGILSTLDLNTVFDGTKFSLFEDTASSDTPFLREAWRAFLVGMLLFLIAEAILCLQPRKSALAPGTPATT